MFGASGWGFHNILFYLASRDRLSCSLLIGRSSSQSQRTRDERDRPLQFVEGDRPHNVSKIAYAESASAKLNSTETKTRTARGKTTTVVRINHKNIQKLLYMKICVSKHEYRGGVLGFRILWDLRGWISKGRVTTHKVLSQNVFLHWIKHFILLRVSCKNNNIFNDSCHFSTADRPIDITGSVCATANFRAM